MASSKFSAIVLQQSECVKVPWKNGQGLTSEIAIYPPGANRDEATFLWRLSSAEIAHGGPFSIFPGYERYLGLVKGNELQLSFEAREKTSKRQISLQRGDVCRFLGDDAVSSTLRGGPVQDLNLIYSPTYVGAVFEALGLKGKPRSFRISGTVGFIYCVEGPVLASIFPGELKFLIPEGDVLRLDLFVAPLSQETLILLEPAVIGTNSKFILIELTFNSDLN